MDLLLRQRRQRTVRLRSGHRARRRRLAEREDRYDVLLTPPACGEAPAGFATTGNSLFNRIWTALGVPAVTIPTGTGPNGLPLGVQFIGKADQDTRLMQAADWAMRRLG